MDYTFQNAIDELEQTKRDRADLIAVLQRCLICLDILAHNSGGKACQIDTDTIAESRALLARLEKGA